MQDTEYKINGTNIFFIIKLAYIYINIKNVVQENYGFSLFTIFKIK